MKILLALFVCLFVPLANWCEARVIVNVGAAPVYGPAPAVSYVPEPTAGYIAPAPIVAYHRSYAVRSYISAPLVGVAAGPTAAQRRHARKAAWHGLRAAYWLSRS